MSELEEKTIQYDRLKAELDAVNPQLDAAKAEIASLRKQVEQSLDAADKARQAEAKAKEDARQKETDLKAVSESIAQTRKAADDTIAKLSADNAALKKQAESARTLAFKRRAALGDVLKHAGELVGKVSPLLDEEK